MIVLYFIMFFFIGFIIGFIIYDDSVAIGSIVVISVLWGFIMGPWAIATFIELLLGYGVVRKFQH